MLTGEGDSHDQPQRSQQPRPWRVKSGCDELAREGRGRQALSGVMGLGTLSSKCPRMNFKYSETHVENMSYTANYDCIDRGTNLE